MKNVNIKQVTTLPVDFTMNECLHKYFENIKNKKKIVILNMKPLNIREPPRGVGWCFHRLWP